MTFFCRALFCISFFLLDCTFVRYFINLFKNLSECEVDKGRMMKQIDLIFSLLFCPTNSLGWVVTVLSYIVKLSCLISGQASIF